MKENKFTYWSDFIDTMKYLKGHLLSYGIGIIGKIIVEASAVLLESYLLKQFLDVGDEQSIGKIAILFGYIILYVCIILLLSPLFTYLFNANAKYGHGAVNKAIYKKYGALAISDLEQNHSGTLLSLFVNDTWVVSTIFMRHFRRVVASLATIIIYLVPMFVLDWRLTAIMLAFNLLTFAVNGWVAKQLKQKTKEIQEKMETTTISIANLVSGMSVIRMYQMATSMKKEFSDCIYDVKTVENKRAKWMSMLSTYQYIVYMVNILIFLGLGTWFVRTGITTYGAILSIMTLQTALDANFKEFGEYYPQFFHGLAATERVSAFEHRDEEPKCYITNENEKEKQYFKTENIIKKCNDEKQTNNLVLKKKNNRKLNNSNIIEFQNVAFGYQPEVKVLSKFNMSIQRGEYVALAGESGSGKSSIAKLLLGFYPIQNGTITVNGYDMMHVPLSLIRQQIAYVPQEPAIYTTTIMENIRYGKPDASDDEVIEAAKKADAYDFIMGQTEGFATAVGENGVRLSGGQKQRIAIARALLKDAPILLLDEATSALDNITEQKILNIIETYRNDKTIIMIAHRKSSIEQADRVIMIGDCK